MNRNTSTSNLKSLGTVMISLIVVIILLSTSHEKDASGQVAESFNEMNSTSNVEQFVGIGNPSAIYCQDVMGYNYQIVTDELTGGQKGYCKMPDGISCSGWDFYSGKCGSQYSYCVKKGYKTVTKTDGNDRFSPEYSICVSRTGAVIGSVANLAILPKIASPLETSENTIMNPTIISPPAITF